MKRSGPIKRKTALKAVSKKRAKVNRERTKVTKQVLAANPRCQAGQAIRPHDTKHKCHGWAVDIHEPLTRARGGSIVDPSNMVAVCRACHDWIHNNPATATTAGLLVSAYNMTYADARDQALLDRGPRTPVDDQQ